MKKSTLITLLFSLLAMTCHAKTLGLSQKDMDQYKANIAAISAKMKQGANDGPFKPNWDSLRSHNAQPDWFLDGKVGIYFHWGVYAVPAYGNEWYMKWMHTTEGRNSDYHKHHVETWGQPDEFGYHDFVPMFTAEHFDAEEWADLFVRSGARWAGPVAEHHDGFSMWDSDITPWNAANVGPRQDIVGELGKAIKARGMKFVTSFHHERTRTWIPRVEGWPTTSDDPVLQFLYMNISEDLFNDIFLSKLGDVIDKYEPDFIWFDGQLPEIREDIHLNFLAYYFNQANRWNKDVLVTTKKLQFPQDIAVMDFEKGRTSALTPWPWLNDDTISTGSWCYTETLQVKPPRVVLHDFIDAVSKNGQLLLNLSPMADGTIPQDQRDCLIEFGDWLEVNGEAIYNTRPWLEFGEGPTRMERSGSHQKKFLEYTSGDIRFTRSKDGKALYVIAMGWPEDGKVSPSILKVVDNGKGKIEMLGNDGELNFKIKDGRLMIRVPGKKPCDYAYAFKLTGFTTSLTADAQKNREATLRELMENPIDPGKKHPDNIMFGAREGSQKGAF